MFPLKSSLLPRERVVNGSRRSDVQGLRAVAVLLVVVFHAGLPVPGGFVGVDVFFVISGFVITGMMHREWSSAGRVSFGRFYLRRFKRLAPALALVIAVTMILSFGLLSPIGIQQLTAQTGVGAMLLIANFVIARNTGGYFDRPAESNPLVHTWSLSVEEQFYLMFPAILVLGWALSRRGRRIPWATVLVGATALASFGLAVVGVGALNPVHGFLSRWWQVTTESALGFYGPLARAWEFAVGALLALVTTSRSLGSDKHAGLLAWLGVALLAGSAWLIDKNTPFLGPWTLLPVGGTLLLIAAGTRHSTWVNRALAVPAMVKIGDWSYSIYLWHWPLTVFAVTLWPQVRFAGTAAAMLSILPAVASYRWVEQPLRQLPPPTARRFFALVGAVVCPPILLATALDFTANHYWLPRYKSGAMTMHPGDTGWEDFYYHLSHTSYPCSDRAIRDSAPKFYSQWGEITRCSQSKPGSRIDVALVGDSHAEHLFAGLASALPDKNIVYYIGAETLPVRSAPGMGRIIDDVASDPGIEISDHKRIVGARRRSTRRARPDP